MMDTNKQSKEDEEKMSYTEVPGEGEEQIKTEIENINVFYATNENNRF